MAKVLVTGATGKIGQAVMSELVSQGHEAVGLYRSNPLPDLAGKLYQADITNPDTYADAIQGCDAVIHLAVDFRRKMMDAVIVEATRNLLKAAHAAGVRYFGYASSVVVYGSPPKRNVTEQTPLIDPAKSIIAQYLAEPFMLDYARTKVAAENLLTSAAAGMTIDIYRPTVVVTVSQTLEAGNWGTARKAQIAHRSTQYITTIDVAAAICHLMTRGLAEPVRNTAEAFNLADETGGTYKALFDKAFRATGDGRYRPKLQLPAIVDGLKDMLKFRTMKAHVPLGRLKISGAKLRQTGFTFPLGVDHALERALADMKNSDDWFSIEMN